MNDRGLLELAAKAYADPNISPGMPDFTRWIGRNEDMGCDVMVRWNPLQDDGDALRLAVKLKLKILPEFRSFVSTGKGVHTAEDWGNDACAATRRAIVRAAAEIGKSLQEQPQ